ncbi:MAG: FHA domain-containing protein [Chloroflexota bacterium]
MFQIVIADIGHRLRLSFKPETLIGRQDAASDTFPDVDLTPYGAVEKGVSRRHARLLFDGSELRLEDIGSVNGTFLNGHRLVPYQSMPLENGDVVQLGMLVFQVFFELPGLLQGPTLDNDQLPDVDESQ